MLLLVICLVQCKENATVKPTAVLATPSTFTATSVEKRLSNAAIALTSQHVQYDPAYFKIPYPKGDVPADKGVCCDVVIRAYRQLGIDLQQRVHEDMAANFSEYPRKWNLRATDTNIDHRRVPNLMTFFTRNDSALPVSNNPSDYQPGDVVCWMLPHELTHIGIVIDSMNNSHQRNLVVHNIGGGQVVSDCLFSFKIIGHYRYRG
jgi:uncharacterized protein YijF (DUF1287 family)